MGLGSWAIAIAGAYSSIFIATPLLAQLKERDPDMKKLAARVRARRTKTEQRAGTPESKPAPQRNRRPEPVTDPEPDGPELSGAELAELAPVAGNARTGSTAVRITAVGTNVERPGVRPMGDGGSKRPQPQHKPRSQRRK